MAQTKSLNSDNLRLGWIAGLIEGEGHIAIRGEGRPNITVAMTDADVIARLHEWTGVGHVRERTSRTVTGKSVFIWDVTKRDDAGELLTCILPLLGVRRSATAQKAIEAWRAYPTRGTSPTCGYGHELSGNNLRLVDGRRRCLQCQARRQRDHRARKTEREAA